MLYKKKRLFFISKKIQLIQKSYNQQCHPLHLRREQYKQLPQKGRKEEKKNLKKGKGKDKKRECEREKKKEKEKENEKEEEKGKEEKKKEEKMKRAVLKVF